MSLRILSGPDVARLLTPEQGVAAVRDAFLAVHRGSVAMPERLHLDAERRGGVTLTMPAHEPTLARTVVKIVSVYPGNRQRAVDDGVPLPVVSGLVTVLDGETGLPLALLDGTELTARRTGAASGVATDALARADARTLALVGAGGQAADQVRAVCAVRDIERVRLANRTPERAWALAERLRPELPDVAIEVADAVADALEGADVVCTATSAQTPVLSTADLAPGTHVNAVGSFQPGMCELPRDLLAQAGRVFVEDHGAALAEAGEVIDALDAGVLTEQDLVPVGAVLAGDAPGRRDDHEVTVFKTCGIAAQDLYAAARCVDRAEAAGSGLVVHL